MNNFFNLLYHRHCWQSRTFYRTQLSSTGFQIKNNGLDQAFDNISIGCKSLQKEPQIWIRKCKGQRTAEASKQQRK